VEDAAFFLLSFLVQHRLKASASNVTFTVFPNCVHLHRFFQRAWIYTASDGSTCDLHYVLECL